MWSDERLDSKSIASKILYKALPNTNNSACASTSRAESKSLDSAIFAKQKSNQCGGAIAPTDTRPCRGGENALKKCSSAFLAFLPRQGYSEALSPIAEKTQRVASKAQQKQRRFILFGAGESGERGNPFSFCANTRF